MTPRIRCRSAADLIIATTTNMGLRPHDSLVMLPLDGRESIAVMRVDLPSAEARAKRHALDAYADRVVGMLLHLEGISSVAAIVYSSASGPRAHCGDVVAAVVRVAKRAGLDAPYLSFLARDAWGTLDPDRPSRARHRPLEELGEVARQPITSVPPRFGRGPAFAPRLDDEAPSIPDLDLDDDELLELLVGSWNPRVQPDEVDHVLRRAATCFGSIHRLEANLAAVAFPGVADDLEPVWREVLDDAAPLPTVTNALRHAFDPDRCERAIAVLEASVDVATERERPHVCAALGWLNWALGRGTQTATWCGEALLDAHSHPLAELVDELSAQCLVPSWFGKPPARPRGVAA